MLSLYKSEEITSYDVIMKTLARKRETQFFMVTHIRRKEDSKRKFLVTSIYKLHELTYSTALKVTHIQFIDYDGNVLTMSMEDILIIKTVV
ncbi:hypothetical protein SALINJAH_287 [Bacillus phage SalinJah]|uniref:Uncharacterized protein n=1 Tax=Bacillus phage SalinJah TaxID=1837830 RepID=A0A173GBB9_9CAUD|nr:hypothetical protein [Bacillus thuringiensis]YP_009282241.1 hypothetical protein SALINJAH_287 [Bacillus phage SalinJah]ANH50644.1 hypothetical protein SALINJAH_287 [Bacillus phage SalinJah]OTZ47940.1 hypothetical protein BK762_19850 [Bacillus thuringiensis serovar toumanoffi]